MFFALTLILDALFRLTVPLTQTSARTYELRGSVIDIHLRAVKDAQIDMAGKMRFTARSAADGSFSLFVPPGSYSLSVMSNGFCPYTRDFVINENSTNAAIAVPLLDCSDCPPMTIDFVDPPVEPGVAPPKPVDPKSLHFKYQQEELEDGDSTRIQPSVLFGQRSDLGKFVEYTGLDCPGREKLPILKYKGGALKATKLLVAKGTQTVTGEGDVTVVDGQGVRRGSKVEIRLDLPIPVAVITK